MSNSFSEFKNKSDDKILLINYNEENKPFLEREKISRLKQIMQKKY